MAEQDAGGEQTQACQFPPAIMAFPRAECFRHRYRQEHYADQEGVAPPSEVIAGHLSYEGHKNRRQQANAPVFAQLLG